MGLLDDAKDKLGDAAEWVKDKAGHLGEQAQGAGQSLGEKAADARHWVGSKVGSDDEPSAHAGGGGTFGGASEESPAQESSTEESSPATPLADGPSPAEEWVEVTSDGSTVDAGSDASDAAGDAPSGAAGILDDEPEQDRSL